MSIDKNKKEKTIRITITVKKILNYDAGTSISRRKFIENNYHGKIIENTREKMLEEVKKYVIQLDEEIDKKKN